MSADNCNRRSYQFRSGRRKDDNTCPIDPRLTCSRRVIDNRVCASAPLDLLARPAITVCRSGAIRDRNNSDKPRRKIRHFRRAIYGGIVSPVDRAPNGSIELSCTTRRTLVYTNEELMIRTVIGQDRRCTMWLCMSER